MKWHKTTLHHEMLFTLASLLGCVSTSHAQQNQTPVPQLESLTVFPESASLRGARSTAQMIVTGIFKNGEIADLTRKSTYSVGQNAPFKISPDGYITPVADGKGQLLVRIGNLQKSVVVEVAEVHDDTQVSFRNDVIAALSVGGCNSGACHGTPSGKNGFKLSLRGYKPAEDFVELSRDVLGRRANRNNPEASLLYLKALGRVPHDGGSRFPEGSIAAKVLLDWLAQGLPKDLSDTPMLKKIEILPGDRVLREPHQSQQLSVVATFANGSKIDVTRLTVFSSSDTNIADVSADGLVRFYQSGEVAILCRYLQEMATIRLTYLESKDNFQWPDPTENNYIDHLVFRKLKLLNIAPSNLCSENEFLRRVYLDVCGILPTPEETEKYLASVNPKKRAELIDSLLQRKEYADLWTLKWSDVLRNSRKRLSLKGAHAFHGWLHSQIQRNRPWNEVVQQLITGSGSTFSNPPANYYRVTSDATELAETTAQVFFGIRMQCAKCHNHPFERWTQQDYYSLASFFSQVRLRNDPKRPGDKKAEDRFVFIDRTAEMRYPGTNEIVVPTFLDGKNAPMESHSDRRKILADWITSADNKLFAKSVVNRIWYHLLGRGIVSPVDDFRESNPSANDPLLNALAKDFIDHNFDMKHLIRTILNSRTYQLSSETNQSNKSDEKYFSHCYTKLYTAEQLFDAICQVTEVPETFAGMPAGTRATQLPDGEFNHAFLKSFGQPNREIACECERESDSNLGQALQLINGATVNDRLKNPNNVLGKLLKRETTDKKRLELLYLSSLSRRPTEAEENAMLAHVQATIDRRRAWEDVLWALINSKEFLFRH